MDKQIITLFNIESLEQCLNFIQDNCIKSFVSNNSEKFETITELILSVRELKKAIEGLDNIQKFIIKNKEN